MWVRALGPAAGSTAMHVIFEVSASMLPSPETTSEMKKKNLSSCNFQKYEHLPAQKELLLHWKENVLSRSFLETTT